MSWKPEVFIQGRWESNMLRFATKEEAESNAADLKSRWTLVDDTRVAESNDPVNYRWVAEAPTLGEKLIKLDNAKGNA